MLGKRANDVQEQSPTKRQKTEEQTSSSSKGQSQQANPEVDFSLYVKMMANQDSEIGKSRPFKQAFLDISKLGGEHLQTNKLSEKMNRRDIQFYDLYKLNEPPKSITELKKEGYAWTENVYDPQIYDDMEVNDFNLIYNNEDLIAQQFGDTIRVQLHQQADRSCLRQVREDLSRVCINNQKQTETKEKPEKSSNYNENDPDLQVLYNNLQNLQSKFKKTKEEIAALWVQCSGDLRKLRAHLDKKEVVMWNYLEDLALAKPDNSLEFQVLLQEKGLEEIQSRR